MITTLKEDNLVDIPDEIAKQFGLDAGSRLDWSAGEIPGTLMIEVLPIEKPAQELGHQRTTEDCS